jgi:hypothetical protein
VQPKIVCKPNIFMVSGKLHQNGRKLKSFLKSICVPLPYLRYPFFLCTVSSTTASLSIPCKSFFEPSFCHLHVIIATTAPHVLDVWIKSMVLESRVFTNNFEFLAFMAYHGTSPYFLIYYLLVLVKNLVTQLKL